MQLIREIETARGSRVIAAILGDRNALRQPVRPISRFYSSALEQIGAVDKIDVVLYTTGWTYAEGVGNC